MSLASNEFPKDYASFTIIEKAPTRGLTFSKSAFNQKKAEFSVIVNIRVIFAKDCLKL